MPHLGDDTAFENSLVSVLENRPADCEVWVAHDGHYGDPFDLGDEVRFITHDSDSLPELIAAAADVVHGRFVHVIAAGVRATEGWVDGALEKFEHQDAAVVAPIALEDINGPITAAGWTSSSSRLTTPVARGNRTLGRRNAAAVRGACLTASFWRREQLRAATRALATPNVSAAQFGWSRLLCQQGWRCVLADQSFVLADEAMLGLCPSVSQGVVLRSLEAELNQVSVAGSALSVGIAAISNLLRPRCWGEVTGEAISLLHRSASVRALHPEMIRSPEETVATIRLPQPTEVSAAVRRAA
ncbi:MAG: hypothetical protein ACO1RT_11010 [Planctomycetaceae bacterium]